MVITRSLTNRASADTATDIELGNCVTEIGHGAFSGYTNLTEIEFPESLTRIGVEAFRGSSVTSVIMPNNVTSIGNSAFNFCKSLTSVTFSNSLATIGASAFTQCSGLTTLTIPSSVTSINDSAFENCKGFTRIDMLSTTPPTLEGHNSSSSGMVKVFDGTNDCPIYVPARAANDYLSSYTWAKYYSRIRYDGAPFKVKFITTGGSETFINCDSSTSVSKPSKMPSYLASTIFGDCVSEIADSGFTGTNLGELTFSPSITRIGVKAFANVLTSGITFAEGLTEIGNYAFSPMNYYPSSPTSFNFPSISVTLPKTLQTIGTNAFVNARISSLTVNGSSTLDLDGEKFKISYTDVEKPLKTLTINGVRSVKGFNRQSGMTSLSISNVDEISASTFSICSALTNVAISTTGSTTIGNNAFEYCYGMTNLSLTEGITSIGSGAFYCCSGLTSVNIPNTVTSINQDTFNNCYNLSSVTLPNNLTSIGDKAFYYCSGLTSVNIPNTVTSIGDSAFEDCRSLSSVTLPSSITSLNKRVFDNCTSLRTLTIPDGVISIGDYAFEYSGLMNVEIPSSVLTIGANAFNGCRRLALLKMKRTTPPTIASNTFSNSSGFIVVPQESLEIYKAAENWSLFADRIIGDNMNIKVMLVSSGSSSNKYVDCNGNSTLAKSEIGGSSYYPVYATVGNCVTEIGEGAFSDIGTYLYEVTIPSNVTTIGKEAFKGCRLQKVSGCEGLVEIGESAFYVASYSDTFTSITLPNTLRTIGASAFKSTRLKSIVIPTGVTVINDSVFYDSKIESISLGNITSIGNYSFYSCENLTSITIPNTVISIGDNAFGYCSNLIEFTVSNSVKNIGNSTFEGCSSLTSITLGNSVETIGESSFYSCTALSSIIIPSSVTDFGSRAFDSCSALTTVVMLPTTPPTIPSIDYYNIFYDCPNLATIYVPSGCGDIYKAASGWSNYADKIQEFS